MAPSFTHCSNILESDREGCLARVKANGLFYDVNGQAVWGIPRTEQAGLTLEDQVLILTSKEKEEEKPLEFQAAMLGFCTLRSQTNCTFPALVGRMGVLERSIRRHLESPFGILVSTFSEGDRQKVLFESDDKKKLVVVEKYEASGGPVHGIKWLGKLWTVEWMSAEEDLTDIIGRGIQIHSVETDAFGDASAGGLVELEGGTCFQNRHASFSAAAGIDKHRWNQLAPSWRHAETNVASQKFAGRKSWFMIMLNSNLLDVFDKNFFSTFLQSEVKYDRILPVSHVTQVLSKIKRHNCVPTATVMMPPDWPFEVFGLQAPMSGSHQESLTMLVSEQQQYLQSWHAHAKGMLYGFGRETDFDPPEMCPCCCFSMQIWVSLVWPMFFLLIAW
jgi:hypothetical protein